MKVLVVGATGGTGQRLLECALQAGHEVTAFVRKPASVTAKHERLRVVQGDVLRQETVAQAMQGQEAVLSAFGPAAGTPSGTLISDGVRNIVQAMKQRGARRLVFESGIMVGDANGMNALKRLMIGIFRSMNRALYEDKVRAEKLVTESGLEWIIVRPPTLKHIPGRGHYRVGQNLDVNIVAGLSYADVADFMVKVLADASWLQQIVYISY